MKSWNKELRIINELFMGDRPDRPTLLLMLPLATNRGRKKSLFIWCRLLGLFYFFSYWPPLASKPILGPYLLSFLPLFSFPSHPKFSVRELWLHLSSSSSSSCFSLAPYSLSTAHVSPTFLLFIYLFIPFHNWVSIFLRD